MFTVEFERKSLDNWQTGIYRKFRKNLETAQSNIRREWQAELNRQSRTEGYGYWQPLSLIYAKRKEREFETGKIPYNTLLKRTGTMLRGYVDGIRFETTNTKVGVEMPYPANYGVATRAKSHQGVIGQPKNVPIRPFDIDRFIDIAYKEFNDAMKKSTE